ncbi:MAG TPA: hypothetical protein DCF65_00185 [Chloroflexi bacterium]|nr:hypothetical protein [Chloroflexota bacterium]HAF19828.1 hypothetical protein [Chloroflexota bacterium]
MENDLYTDHTPDSDCVKFPDFGSREHLEWISRRQQKNIQFRQQCEEWAKVPLEIKRAMAA